MKVWTVQDLIDALEIVDDKQRSVMVAGGSPLDGVRVLGIDRPGHIIMWCDEKWVEKGRPGW